MALLFGAISLSAGDVLALKVDTTKHEVTAKSIEAAFDKAGFIVQSNNDLSGVFKTKFKLEDFDAYHLLSVYDPMTVNALVKDSIDAALFEPFTIVLYQRKGNPFLHAALLRVEARSRLTKTDNSLEAAKSLNSKVETTLQKAMLDSEAYDVMMTLDVVKEGDIVTRMTKSIKDDDYEAFKDEFDIAFEERLDEIDFYMANYLDLVDDVGEEYLFFEVYALCKLSILAGMVQKMPEAGVLAPCAVMVYQKKGSDEFTVAYANVQNWIQTFGVEDKEGKEYLMNINKQIAKVITDSLAVEVEAE